MEIKFPSLDGALADLGTSTVVADRFHWNLSVERAGEGDLQLFAGELLLAVFVSESELTAFVAGMAAALVVLPDEIAQAIDEYVGV